MATDILPDVQGGTNIKEAVPTMAVSAFGMPQSPGATSLEQAALEKRAYSTGTGTQAIAAGERLKLRIENPVGSGKKIVIRDRRFFNNRSDADALLERVLILDAPALLDAQPAVVNKLSNDPAAPSPNAVANVTFSKNSDDLSNGNVGAPMPLDGIPALVDTPREIYPGQSMTYQIEGAGGVVTNSPARASIIYQWEEVDYDG